KTLRTTAVVLARLPEVPVMVTVAIPVTAAAPAENVTTLVAVAGLGLNDAVTPSGRPDADRVTLPLNPNCGVIVTVLVPLAPWLPFRLDGDDDNAKFGGGGGGEEMETLSKVAVARAVLSLALRARPT